MSAVTITSLQLENTMRIKAFYLEPTKSGLTIIGGKNRQGKTSAIKGLAWVLGGARFCPSDLTRDDAMNPATGKVVLSNGLVATRSGKNGSLKVTDPSGESGGQAILTSFIGDFALNLPKFMNEPSKAKPLLQILGIGDKLTQLDKDEERIYNERHTIGQIAESKKKHSEELSEYPDAPKGQISVSDLIQEQQAIMVTNGENQKKRNQVGKLEESLESSKRIIEDLQQKILDLNNKYSKEHESAQSIREDLAIAQKSAEELHDESTAELEESLSNVEAINDQVAANETKARAQDEAEEFKSQYDAKTEELSKVRTTRTALLDNADLPLPGLTIEKGELLYNGKGWDCMAGSDQLIIATSIVRKLNPNCGFVLMDKLEAMDLDTLATFGTWLEKEGLQVIATRVSTGDECSIIIEDGLPQGETFIETVTQVKGTPLDFDGTVEPMEGEDF